MCSVHFRGEFFSSSHQFVKEAWTELIKCVPKFVLSRHGLCRIYTHFVANPILSQMSAVLGLFCPDFYSYIDNFTLHKQLAAGSSG